MAGPSNPDASRPARRLGLLLGLLAGLAAILFLRTWRPTSGIERLWEVRDTLQILGVHGGRIVFQHRNRLGWRAVGGGPERTLVALSDDMYVAGSRTTPDGVLVSLMAVALPGAPPDDRAGVWEVRCREEVTWLRTELPWLPDQVVGRRAFLLRIVPPLSVVAQNAGEAVARRLGRSGPTLVATSRDLIPPAPAPRPMQLLRSHVDRGGVEEVAVDLTAPATLAVLDGALCVRSDLPEGGCVLLFPERGTALTLPGRPSGVPAAAAGRLWWLEAPDAALPAGSPSTLMSCDLEGRDVQAWGPLPSQTFPFLGANGRLVWAHQHAGRDVLTLTTLDPGSRPRLRGSLIGHAFQPMGMDGEHLYFALSEMRENWLDWSPRGLQARRVRVLYRCRP